MGRLADGEKESKENALLRFLKCFGLGLTEAELAQELGWERRTVNNYLRTLEKQTKAYKDGRVWVADEDE